MNEERFQRLMNRLDEMSDESFFQFLRRAGMVVEKIPEGADLDQVVVEVGVFAQEYRVASRTSLSWNIDDNYLDDTTPFLGHLIEHDPSPHHASGAITISPGSPSGGLRTYLWENVQDLEQAKFRDMHSASLAAKVA